ncbi:uncharacterized protein [Antedon mediterranea]|uniref:uncharacterized protein n=1 Tax=Antedon mediterranea TaxID=105859 RepID=UPI003AF45208
MAAAKTQGSWFSSGYHGHFRSQSRNDFVNEYRRQAKPSPPQKFSKLLQERPTVHHFSKHDNRFSFLNTVDSFQDGLGKKKVHSSYKSKFLPDFISWVPHKTELKESGPAFSSYRNDFRSKRGDVPQILVRSTVNPESSNTNIIYNSYSEPIEKEVAPLTTYRFVYQHQQPNPKVNTNMNTGKVDGSVPFEKSFNYVNPKHKSIYDRPSEGLTNLRRSRVKSAPFSRTTVADCLNWYRGPVVNETIETLEKRPKTSFSANDVPQDYYTNGCSLPEGSYKLRRPEQTVATAPVTINELNGNNSGNSSLPPPRTLITIGNEPE